MSSRALKGRSAAPDVPAQAVLVQRDGAPSRPSTRIPRVLKLPLLIVLSLNLSAVLYSLGARYLGADMNLSMVSRNMKRGEGWWDGMAMAGTLVGWKMFEVAVGWWEDYDAYDLAALTLLSHFPPLYLLGTFYRIRPTAVVSFLVIDILTMFIPLRLLRPLSQLHAASATTIPNRDIVADSSVQTLTTLLAASIYGTTLYFAYVLGLPVYLVTYFRDLPSVEAAHSFTPITLIALLLPLGLAAKSFIFTPAAATASSAVDARNAAFDPAAATLGETFCYNVWGYKSRTKMVIRRTATVMLFTGVNTFLRTWLPLDGVEAVGAATYAGVWVVAAGATGVSLGAVVAV